ncbi:hypothetical protein D3C72_1883970 [compost metagenome]
MVSYLFFTGALFLFEEYADSPRPNGGGYCGGKGRPFTPQPNPKRKSVDTKSAFLKLFRNSIKTLDFAFNFADSAAKHGVYHILSILAGRNVFAAHHIFLRGFEVFSL